MTICQGAFLDVLLLHLDVFKCKWIMLLLLIVLHGVEVFAKCLTQFFHETLFFLGLLLALEVLARFIFLVHFYRGFLRAIDGLSAHIVADGLRLPRRGLLLVAAQDG